MPESRNACSLLALPRPRRKRAKLALQSMDIQRNPFELLSSQLSLITARLSLLQSLPFDRDEYLLQGDALISDIQAAQLFFVELKHWDSVSAPGKVEEATLDGLLSQIDYDLAVIQRQTSSLEKGFPEDERFYRDRLFKLSEEGERLNDLNGRLAGLYSRYCS